jgi:hypothetical protein
MWKRSIAVHQLPGTPIFVNEPIIDELLESFSFRGFPSDAFFDVEGSYKKGAILWPSRIKVEELKELVQNK